MGYDLSITRQRERLDETLRITPEEWLAVVQDDPELTISGQHGPHPYMADWSGPGEYPCWIDYSDYDGDLYSKNPTDEMIDKMVQIAKRLDAKVIGEEGEEYLGGSLVAKLVYDDQGAVQWVVRHNSDIQFQRSKFEVANDTNNYK